ncbi:hypothetical protein [Sphingomonas sp. BK580]|uniref:hypothetical protein n=1 Tax=Sphingomonas sp. BK580 TaxID=2586972 RepID=UPI0016160B76|nr:hypothetical protein [Sphingomonas sp. BK580]MBB3695267.1 hypothetical protein [Sphingomonas sp. BK580]
MTQTTLCVPLEVRPESCSRLTALIEQFKRDEDEASRPDEPHYARLTDQLPTLHFLSLSVFPAHDYDPVFIVEANFDGDENLFWRGIAALMDSRLCSMLRCCKRPIDGSAALYDAAIDEASASAAYLRRRVQRPSVFHHGNRGLSCAQIRSDRALFLDAVAELDGLQAHRYRGVSPTRAHGALREALIGRHPWLARTAARRLPMAQAATDYVMLVGLIVGLLAAMAAPGLAAWGAGARWLPWWVMALIGIAGCAASFVLWLRVLERRDSVIDRPKIDEALRREMVRREDWVVQNHMGSIVLIKPGVLRTAIIRLGHRALHLLLRASPRARKGYLGSMRTVHFAHWAFLNNRSRLLFLSNFDHSWDSYLDDFIEKAHVGLTLAWGCGVGFPATKFLIKGGASHGRQFKAWALASRTASRFWYSAYPDLTVDQIERNHRIAEGLRRAKMNDAEAARWMLDL